MTMEETVAYRLEALKQAQAALRMAQEVEKRMSNLQAYLVERVAAGKDMQGLLDSVDKTLKRCREEVKMWEDLVERLMTF